MESSYQRRYSKNAREKKPDNVSKSLALLTVRFNSVENEQETKIPLVQIDQEINRSSIEDNRLRVENRRPRSNSDIGPMKLPPLDALLIRDQPDLLQRLDMMHERCITRNLHTAGLGGNAVDNEFLKKLLDPNARMVTGETMLIATIVHIKNEEIKARYASILLSEGADVNAVDNGGKTALMYTCAGGHERVLKLLLQLETIDLLQRDNEGNTALMYAASSGSVKTLKKYLRAIRKYDKVPIQQPIQDSFQKVDVSTGLPIEVSTLGSDLRARSSSIPREDPLEMQNAQGNTARALALKNCHLDCADLLNEERLRRRKERKKRSQVVLGHHQAPSASPFGRSIKKPGRKHLLHSSSFDSVYNIDQGNQSDDNLLQSPLKEEQGKRDGKLTTFSMEQAEKRVKTRLRSDLVALRTSRSCELIKDIDRLDINGDRSPINGHDQGITKRRQTLQDELKPQLNSDHGLGQKFRKYSMRVPSANQYRMNLTEKVMNFLRRRPKYYASVGTDQSITGHVTPPTAKRSTSSIGFSNVDPIDSSFHRPPEMGLEFYEALQRYQRKNHSQSDVQRRVLMGASEKRNDGSMKRRSMDASIRKSDTGRRAQFPIHSTRDSRQWVPSQLGTSVASKTPGGINLPALKGTNSIMRQSKDESRSSDDIYDSGVPSTSSSAAATSRPWSADSVNKGSLGDDVRLL